MPRSGSWDENDFLFACPPPLFFFSSSSSSSFLLSTKNDQMIKALGRLALLCVSPHQLRTVGNRLRAIRTSCHSLSCTDKWSTAFSTPRSDRFLLPLHLFLLLLFFSFFAFYPLVPRFFFLFFLFFLAFFPVADDALERVLQLLDMCCGLIEREGVGSPAIQTLVRSFSQLPGASSTGNVEPSSPQAIAIGREHFQSSTFSLRGLIRGI